MVLTPGALAAFKRPSETIVSARLGFLSTDWRRWSFVWVTVIAGLLLWIRAAVPATRGVAIEVPE